MTDRRHIEYLDNRIESLEREVRDKLNLLKESLSDFESTPDKLEALNMARYAGSLAQSQAVLQELRWHLKFAEEWSDQEE